MELAFSRLEDGLPKGSLPRLGGGGEGGGPRRTPPHGDGAGLRRVPVEGAELWGDDDTIVGVGSEQPRPLVVRRRIVVLARTEEAWLRALERLGPLGEIPRHGG